jgi:hypothetical protein
MHWLDRDSLGRMVWCSGGGGGRGRDSLGYIPEEFQHVLEGMRIVIDWIYITIMI